MEKISKSGIATIISLLVALIIYIPNTSLGEPIAAISIILGGPITTIFIGIFGVILFILALTSAAYFFTIFLITRKNKMKYLPYIMVLISLHLLLSGTLIFN